jgi:hypothetical protein
VARRTAGERRRAERASGGGEGKLLEQRAASERHGGSPVMTMAFMFDVTAGIDQQEECAVG